MGYRITFVLHWMGSLVAQIIIVYRNLLNKRNYSSIGQSSRITFFFLSRTALVS